MGSIISSKYKILILDKKEIGTTTKSWTSWPKNLDDNNLHDCIYNKIDKALIRSAPGDYITFGGHLNKWYPIVNEKKVLQKWIKVLKKNKSVLMSYTNYKEHKVYKDYVLVKTSKGNFTCRLLIDGSGFNSPIVKRYKLLKRNEFYWSVYGAIADNINGMKKNTYIVYETFNDKKPRLIWMYMPISSTKGIPEVFYLTQEQIPLSKMRKDFKYIIKKSPEYSRYFKNAKIIEEKFGWVPVGRELKTTGLNRVGFIGDAAGWDYALGWGFNYILLHYKKYGNQIIKLLDEDKLSKQDLNVCLKPNVKEDFQTRIEELTIALLAKGNGEECDQFYQAISKIDPKFFEKWLLLKFHNKDLLHLMIYMIRKVGIKKLLKILEKEHFDYIIKEFESITEDELKEKFKL